MVGSSMIDTASRSGTVVRVVLRYSPICPVCYREIEDGETAAVYYRADGDGDDGEWYETFTFCSDHRAAAPVGDGKRRDGILLGTVHARSPTAGGPTEHELGEINAAVIAGPS